MYDNLMMTRTRNTGHRRKTSYVIIIKSHTFVHFKKSDLKISQIVLVGKTINKSNVPLPNTMSMFQIAHG